MQDLRAPAGAPYRTRAPGARSIVPWNAGAVPEAAELQESCPLCGEPFGKVELSEDHIFGRAWGGRATVTTHRSCNSELGHGAEGQLHKPWSLLSLAKASNGLPGLPMDATMPDGTRIKIDFASQTSTLGNGMVRIEETPEIISFYAQASSNAIQGIVSSWRKNWPDVPEFEDLPSGSITQVQRTPEAVQVTLTHDLGNAVEIAKKAALGAGVKAFGAEFAAGRLAERIRAASLESDRSSITAVEQVWSNLSLKFDDMRAAGLDIIPIPEVLPAPQSQVVFMPNPMRKSTVIYVHILGIPLVPWGIVIAEPLPDHEMLGKRQAPVLVREEKGKPLSIFDLTVIGLGAVAKAAQDAADRIDEEA